MTSDDKTTPASTDTSRGIAFGTGVAYDDAYGYTDQHDTTTEVVDDMDIDDDDTDDVDTGIIAAHPSTLASQENNNANNDNNVQKEYHDRRHNREVQEDGMSFKDAILLKELDREKAELEKERDALGSGVSASSQPDTASTASTATTTTTTKRRRRRWDDSSSSTNATNATTTNAAAAVVSDSEASSTAHTTNANKWDSAVSTATTTSSTSRRRRRWDETPVAAVSTGANAAAVDATPVMSTTQQQQKWDETPLMSTSSITETPANLAGSAVTGTKKRSRWDSTPAPGLMTPATPSMGAAPLMLMSSKMSKEQREIAQRNAPWTNEALDAMLPGLDAGYVVIHPPESYRPLRTPGRKLLATPTPVGVQDGFIMSAPEDETSTARQRAEAMGISMEATGTEIPGGQSLPLIQQEDYQYFGKLMTEVDDSELSKDEQTERRIMTLLLKIKSGTPPQRKTAMRQITDKARSFGAGPLFAQILPLLMSPTLEEQERHFLVKVCDRVLYQLDDLVRPYVHRILAVIQPLLIDEDYFARCEGREIISNLAKAAGLPTMIATMRPDVDHADEYVRNTTARAFAVVASALGVPSLLPFLKAVCRSKKSWQARHTGVKIVQQIATLMGCAVLPYLKDLVDICSGNLIDEQQKVRIMTALTLAALAEAAHPYGIESFDPVLRPLWMGIKAHRGKALAAFLKAIGYIIPLMEEGYAAHYTREVMPTLIREFQSPDEEMKKIVLKVVQQCVATAGVEPSYIRTEILPEFFKHFWIRRMALDRRNYQQVVDATEELANKIGSSDIISRIVDDLKDDSEPYRRMVMETVQKVLTNLGAGDIDARLEERLIDGMLYAFQEQAVDNASINFGRDGQVMLDGFGTVVQALGERSRPYLKQIAGTIKWRLNNKSAAVRMQAADLIGRIASVMKACDEDQLMGHLGVVLYEYLGEEYPEVLGSILGALRAIVNVIGMTKMTPPIRDLLPRLTPIMRNRHEKVQENCIDLVGRIADRGAEFVSAKEWMRICFELLEMLKAHKKAIRRAAVSTFGYIAKAIGPQDVLHTLLNNLKVQDRQMRVCTTVAIAIVAETCAPFTVLPAVMNEYRVPELNIQNGVLKALSFMFEYIGDMAKDYIYAVAPLLEDALMDRDQVHRQTGCSTVKHLALGVAGLGCEDALLHLLNFVWPNIFEESPHVIRAVFDAVEGLMVGLGPNVILAYVMQGLYHPARKVREVYWKVFNTLYIYNSDALVMGYPALEDDSNNNPGTSNDGNEVVHNDYTRTTLELFI